MRSDVACIGSLDRYLIMRCFGEISAEAIYATMEAHATCQAYRGSSVGSLVFIDPATQLPTEEARKASVDMIKKTKGTVCSSATVVLGDGFWASALRGVLTTFNVLSASAHPVKTFRHAEESIDWTLAITGDDAAYRKALLDAFAATGPTNGR